MPSSPAAPLRPGAPGRHPCRGTRAPRNPARLRPTGEAPSPPPPVTPGPSATSAGGPVAVLAATTAETTPDTSAPVIPSVQAPAVAAPPTTPETAPAAPDRVKTAQFYIDEDLRKWLERDIRAASLMQGIDVSGSAVVRLALRRLQTELSTQQILDALATKSTTPKGGRPRR